MIVEQIEKETIESGGQFPQSTEWGDILVAEGKEVKRLVIKEGGETIGFAQVVYSRLPFGGKYAFCPKGPVIKNGVDYGAAVVELMNYLKKDGCVFFRIEPEKRIEKCSGLIVRTIDINPPATLILDLLKSETDLLLGMHPKTRYNIGLAQKKGVTVENKKDFDVFWDLSVKTGKRDNFKLHHREHYQRVFESPLSLQLTAYNGGAPVACVVCIKYGDTFTYLYGASDYEHRNLMAPYLLQWEAIKLAKAQGFKHYDFFGVAPRLSGEGEYRYDPKHQYGGVTRFKLGFGGKYREDAGTWDVVIDKKQYYLYKLLRWIRRMW